MAALRSMKRAILTVCIGLSVLWGSPAIGQTGASGWNGTWAGGWDRGTGVQLIFAGDQLAAFYWRGDYQDVRHASAGKGNKRFAWEKGEATLTRSTEDTAQLVVQEPGRPALSIPLIRE